MFDIEKTIKDLMGVSKCDRETNINFQGKVARVFTSDYHWLNKSKKKILLGLENGQIDIVRFDKYGIIFTVPAKFISFHTPKATKASEEEEEMSEDE